MKYSKFILIGMLCVIISGCATIFKGSSADIRVNSAPSGATIYINEVEKGVTPQTISLKRSQNHILTFKKDGYEDVNLDVTKKFDVMTTVVGNVFSWSLLGIIVDVASGAAYSLEPYELQANMDAMRTAGYLDGTEDIGEDDIFVVMLTTEQWNDLQANAGN